LTASSTIELEHEVARVFNDFVCETTYCEGPNDLIDASADETTVESARHSFSTLLSLLNTTNID
jgi:hypothetical protein